MKFGEIPVAEAQGSILAHSMRLEGRRLKKGRVLTGDDVLAMQGAKVQSVTVAQPEASDILEDEAADRLAAALVPDPSAQGLWRSAPFTGRANIYAETLGVLNIDTDAVRALNGLHEALTLATLDNMTRVAPRQMIATVKIDAKSR